MLLLIVLFHMAFPVDCCLHDGCDCSSTTVFCDSVGLSSLVAVKYLPSDTNTMVITGNRIDEITKKSFFNLTQLQTIYLQKNNIAKLDIGSFERAPVLKLLNLSSNRMTRIVDGTFRGLDRLTFLDLTNNEITALARNAFEGLLSLSELYLSDNGLTNIPNGVFASLRNLNHLKLNGNKLVTLPDGVFSTLNKLSELHLSYNRLHTITSAQFAGMGKLERLDLQGNRLVELDPVATDVENVNTRTCLQTNDSPPRKFPHPGLLSGLKQLKHLDISNNSLTTLSALSFTSLRKLTLLKVSANRWRCDCQLKRTLLHMREEHDDYVPKHHHVICWLPVKLRGVSIDDLKFLDLEDLANTTRRKMFLRSSVATNQPTTLSTADIQTRKSFSSDLATTFNILLGTSGQLLSTNKPPAWSRQPLSFPTINLRQNAATATSRDRVDVTTNENRFTELENKRFDKRNNSRFDYSDTEDFPPYEENKPALQQNELISWLMLVAAIFTVFAVVVCGVAFKRNYNQEGGSLCGCCFGSDKTTGQYPSDSVRSFSNYPLLYDNPLARRPLPRQPAVTRRDHHNTSLSAISALQSGVDVRWTCGGSFGIGDSRPRSVIPGRFISRLGEVCTPPVVPPRDQLDSSWDDEESGCSHGERHNYRASTRHEDLQRQLHLVTNDVTSAASFSDVSTLSPRSHSYPNRRSLQINVIEKEDRLRRESPRSSSERHCKRQRCWASTSVSRNGSDVSEKGRHFSKRSTKRDRDMTLEVLDETKTARHHKRDNYAKVHCNKRHRAPKTPSIGSKILLQIPSENKYRAYIDDNCLLGSVAPRNKVRRGASARYSGEKPIEYFCQQSTNRKVNAKLNKYSRDCKSAEVSSVRRSQSMNHQQRMDEVNFKFPPPPPLLNISSEAGSQAESLSLSEKSYNFNLPSPLPCGDVIFETPTFFYDDNSSSLSSDDVKNYSILALCSSGHSRKDDVNLVSKSTDKSERKFRSALHCRLDSVDSMHASRDTNCESLSEDSSTDFDNNQRRAFDEVVYRDPKRSLDVPHYKHEHRKSMPVFDEVMRYAQPSCNSVRSLAASEITFMGSDSFIYKSVSRYPKCHQLRENRSSHLDLSLSDSEWETTVAGSCTKKLPATSKSGRSCAGSTDNIAIPEAAEERESNSYKTKSQRRQFSGLSTNQSRGARNKSESSQGSESVSSIEFESPKLDEDGDQANTYQALHQMYSGQMLQSTKSEDSRGDKSRLRAPPPRILINAEKLSNVDVTESSTDDVSTDIEMLDLGPA